MNGLLQDLRYALRQLHKSPGFTAIAVITLAIGIGANSAIFSVVNGVLLQPLPFPHAERLVRLTDFYPQGAYAAMRANLRTMEVAAYRDGTEANLSGVGEPQRLHGYAVSSNFFSVLGARAEAGRVLVDGEDQPGNDNVILLSHELAQNLFGSDAQVLGRSLTLDGVDRQIVGVMPANFRLESANPQFWVPLRLDPRNTGAYWGSGFMPVIGRLRPGATQEEASAELRANIPQLRRMFPWRMPDSLWASVSAISLRDSIVGDVKTKLLVLLGAISLVLLIACANVANLLLARAAARQKEIAMRSALGAGRWRVFRQLLTESVLLGAAGGMGGLLLAFSGLPALKTLLSADTPRLASVGIDWRVLAFTAAAAFLTGLLFGIMPALHASDFNISEAMKVGWQRSATGASQRLRSTLAISELSLAIVLMISAGLLVKSLWELAHVKAGFQTDSVLTARLTPSDRFCRASSRCRDFYNDLLQRVQAGVGVRGAAFVSVLPLSGRIDAFSADLEDHPRNPSDAAPVLFESIVSPDYFRVLEIPVLRGRGFTAEDMGSQATPVAVISAATAQKYWPNQDPVGKRLKRVADKGWLTIVGVVADVNEYSLASRLPDFAEGAVYRTYGNDSQHGPTEPAEMTLVVRTASNSSVVAGDLRRIVASMNPDVPVSEVQTFSAVVSQSLEAPRSIMWLFIIFAAVAVVLGVVGVYGVISYGVAQRVREIGVRIALGAAQRDVMWLVLKEGGQLALIGVALGTGVAILATHVISSLLFAVSTTDSLTYGAAGVLLVVVALAATWVPARRAAKVDPMVALRYE